MENIDVVSNIRVYLVDRLLYLSVAVAADKILQIWSGYG